MLVDDGFLTAEQTADHPEFGEGKVDYGGVYEWKNKIHRLAYEGLHQITSVDLRGKFETFQQENGWWRDDIRTVQGSEGVTGPEPWYEWPTSLKLRDHSSLDSARNELFDEILARNSPVPLLNRQWGLRRSIK